MSSLMESRSITSQEYDMSSNDDEHWIQILDRLKFGSILTKRKRNGEKYTRQFFLDKHEGFLSYRQSEKVFAQSHCYFIHKIDEIRAGFHTRTFDRLVRREMIERTDEQLAFSIFYNNYRDELHLTALNEQTRDLWIQGLQYLIDVQARKRQQHVIDETNWMLSYFRLADKDRSGTLTKRECRRLLTDSLNAKVPEDVFEKLFKEADRSGEGLLNPDEFIDFFHVLTRRRDLYRIMQKYVKNGADQSIETICMNVDELLYFLRTVQNQTLIKCRSEQINGDFSLQPVATHKQVQELINQFEPNVDLQEKALLSLNGFRNLLLSEDFCLMRPWCSRRPYQDMTRPLSDYFISTSHNTYLFNTQVSGESNPEAYNRALRAGCRAVEIDCYDGDNGRPIVKHRYTLVKSCSFESIIRFIEPNLFKTSPYPVILDLENHCSIEQQKEMARILIQVLGDRLVTKPLSGKNTSVLPSPEDLKYRVLIRGIKIPTPTPTATVKLLQEDEIDDDNSLLNPQSKVIEHHLADLFVYLQNVPYRKYEYTNQNYLCFHSSSLSERHFERIARSDSIGLLNQTQKCLFRMYPDGLRQDSSNPNPINAWNFGLQMVALNYQNDDHQMSLCYGKFLDNGACGYILKPNYLLDIQKSQFNPFDYLSKPTKQSYPKDLLEYPQRLILTIISGQFLSRSSETTDDIPDPYVVISTHGILCDQQVHKTKFIENNGFNPQWNETFVFDIHFPQMCLVRFDVYDYDVFSRDDRLAYFCLPMTTMQTGYRHIHLRTKENDSTFSTLFVHVTIENL